VINRGPAVPPLLALALASGFGFRFRFGVWPVLDGNAGDWYNVAGDWYNAGKWTFELVGVSTSSNIKNDVLSLLSIGGAFNVLVGFGSTLDGPC